MARQKWAAPGIAVLGAVLLTSCGGGGGGGVTERTAPAATSSQSNVLSGTVAVGKPLANIKLTVFSIGSAHSSGFPVVDAQTDANGYYSVNVDDLKPPYLVHAYNPTDETYIALESVSNRAGTVNVTPLTDLLVAQLVPKNQYPFGVALDKETLTLKQLTEAQISDAREKVVDYLRSRPSKHNQNLVAPIDVSMVVDFISTPFAPKAGDVYDDALEALTASLMDGENLLGVKEDMRNKGATIADLTQLPLPAAVECDGNVCGINSGNTIVAPYYSKYSLVNALMMQILQQSAALELDCGASPALPGFMPNMNRVVVEGPVLRMNGAILNGFAFPLLSAKSFHVWQTSAAGDPSQRYISSLFARTNAVSNDGMSVDMRFDSAAQLTKVDFSVTKGGVTNTVECMRL